MPGGKEPNIRPKTILAESLVGATTVRAYGDVPRLAARNLQLLERNMCAFYHMQAANRWLGLRVDMVGALMVLCAALASISLPMSTSVVGLLLVTVLSCIRTFRMGVKISVDTEARPTRVLVYSARTLNAIHQYRVTLSLRQG